MSVRKPLRLLLVLPALFALSCGSDDTPTNPNGGGGGGGTSPTMSALSADVDAVVGTYLDANAAAYQSLALLGPEIGLVLSAGSGPMPTSGAAQASCLPPEWQGATFEWDGTMYVLGADPGAPPDGIRFHIYALAPGGAEPDTNNVIGYLEATCTVISTNSFTVTLACVIGGTTIFYVAGQATEGTGTVYATLQGFLGAGGAPNLDTFITVSKNENNATAEIGTLFDLLSRDIELGVTVRDSAMINRRAMTTGAAKGIHSTLQWVFNVHALADLSENIEQGAAYLDTYGPTPGYSLVACVNGGTLPNPVVTAPDASCDTWIGGAPVGASTEADRTAARAAYVRLYALHTAVRELLVDIFNI